MGVDTSERTKEIEEPPQQQQHAEKPAISFEDLDGQAQAEALHQLIRKSCIEMALNRVDGDDELYVGGIWALRRPSALKERNITHILSVVRFDPLGLKSETDTWENYGKNYKHMIIDIDDVEDSDLLVHLPQAVRFIDEALYPGEAAAKRASTKDDDDDEQRDKNFKQKVNTLKKAVEHDANASESDEDAITPAAAAPAPPPEFKDLTLETDENRPPAVYVHCAMGKSRSVSVVVAYLLWKHPSRFGRSAASTLAARKTQKLDEKTSERARVAVEEAVRWVRRTREIAEPNPGFARQLEMWWAMGCPEDVEGHPVYRRWAFQREIDESLAAGQAPSRLRFEDEEVGEGEGGGAVQGKELRCKKCRRTLATPRFVLEHEPEGQKSKQQQACGHWFVEPLSWMREELEKGALEGRLCCPNAKCGAAVGRYSWKGFRCSCGGWVTPGFSLQRARVDEVAARVTSAAGMASLGIRMPPGTGRL
ncbi:dual specificity [Colletotrichum karsti]|uniref:protein-tyrosine-phosphatase n=1 Tax=Colletotrichum karsti TaxID=1095194 RepID=A0A9P6I7B3_9PEZI|nr:dual specificity [Colletotrichum karsti]KAF9878232.1 dual specificity [Colletotrichum karsti]